MNAAERLSSLLARTEKQSDGCLLWTGPIRADGYIGTMHLGKSYLGHRLVYTLAVGPIPEDRPYIDHACHSRAVNDCTPGLGCRHRQCLNPQHLEPVTPQENVLRSERAQRTHCVRGHAYSPENTRMYRNKRQCRACNLIAARKSAAKRVAA